MDKVYSFTLIDINYMKSYKLKSWIGFFLISGKEDWNLEMIYLIFQPLTI